jgi:predicted DNA-binding transcriptional regulator YafY
VGYRSSSNLLRLALELETKALSIAEIRELFGIGRSSVYRMLDALKIMLKEYGVDIHEDEPDDEEHGNLKRWTIDHKTFQQFYALTKEEHLALDRLVELANISDSASHAHILNVSTKIKAASERPNFAAQSQIDELIERQGWATRVGLKIEFNEEIISSLEYAIMHRQKVKLLYRQNKNSVKHKIMPLAILRHRCSYLVHYTDDQTDKPQLMRLDLIRGKPKLMQENFFKEAENFNLSKWAGESFGIGHEDKITKIILCCQPEAIERLEVIQLHPSQWISSKKAVVDESQLVHLECRGHEELLHELMHPDWIGLVKIEKPESLKIKYSEYLNSLATALV